MADEKSHPRLSRRPVAKRSGMENEMDTNQEKIELPEIVYQGEDQKLQERIGKFKAGTFRIILFSIVGMIMGWFSFEYYGDSFLLTKVILAVPYKISEAIYVTIIGTGAEGAMQENVQLFTAFFPYSPIATFLAERITPVLLGGAIYGALAYFTGDKRVFTLPRFIRFFGVWCMVILLYVGGVYVVNALTAATEAAQEVSERAEEIKTEKVAAEVVIAETENMEKEGGSKCEAGK